MKTKLLLIIISLFYFFTSSAQYNISGRVVDESDEYIEGAIVRLINAKDSVINTTVADSNVFFQIKTINSGEYRLQLSMVGRITQNIEI